MQATDVANSGRSAFAAKCSANGSKFGLLGGNWDVRILDAGRPDGRGSRALLIQINLGGVLWWRTTADRWGRRRSRARYSEVMTEIDTKWLNPSVALEGGIVQRSRHNPSIGSEGLKLRGGAADDDAPLECAANGPLTRNPLASPLSSEHETSADELRS
jgi:hypothetical protein